MNNINDIFSTSNPESQENMETVIHVTANRILKDYQDAHRPVPDITYPSFSPELDRSHPYVDLIVDGIHASLERCFRLEAGSHLAPDILRRIFEGVFIRLKLHPIQEKDKKGKVTVYHSDSELSEVFGEPSDTLEYHNRVQTHLEKVFWEMNQELSRHILDRFDALEDYFHARSDAPRDNALTTILQCGIDIRRAREKISDFCAKNDMQNPFDSSEHTSSQSNFSDDTPYLRTLSEIFTLSKSERFLKQFLPEDTPEEESYLFYFSLDDSDVFDEASFEKQRFDICGQIYERKLLIYFYASRQLQHTKEVSHCELRQKLSDLSFEIKAYKKSVDAPSGGSEMYEESIAENDIARVEMLYARVESLRRKYSAVQTGYDISQVFYTISQSLSLFIDTVGSRLSALETSEEQKEAILVSLRSTLHATLQRCWHQLGSSREESIVAMRRILNEALEFLVHD